MNVMITRGTGYIGSHTVNILLEIGCKVSVIDNRSTGNFDTVDKRTEFHNADIKDYIHIEDLIDPHILAVHKILESYRTDVINFGSGEGYNELEKKESVREITKQSINAIINGRRVRELTRLKPSSEKEEKELKWLKKHIDASSIIASTWKFNKLHKEGFNNENI